MEELFTEWVQHTQGQLQGIQNKWIKTHIQRGDCASVALEWVSVLGVREPVSRCRRRRFGCQPPD